MLNSKYLLTTLIASSISVNSLCNLSILEAFFLSIIQGITEWFPISSSGHLVLFQELFNIRVSAAFDILLHAGSLIGIIFFMRRDLYDLFKPFFKLNPSNKEERMLIYLMLGTFPIIVSGLLFKDFVEMFFTNILSTGVAMLINGVIIFLTKKSRPKSKLNASNAFLIGVSQAFAIIPGISRMGITVSTALILGLEYGEAYRFSLLLSLLSIAGGCVFSLFFKFNNAYFEVDFLLSSIVITAVVSVLALRFLKKYVSRQSFYKFAYYCLALGGIILLSIFLKTL